MSLTLPPLPYALDALEPHVSRRTLATHHGRHHAAYVEKTRALVQRTALEGASLEEIVRSSAMGQPAVQRRCAGVESRVPLAQHVFRRRRCGSRSDRAFDR
jgi:superoxide dismutase